MISINTKQVTREYRLGYWAQVMQTRANSGQSVQDFCAMEGISKNTYFYWQRKLREAAYMKIAEQNASAETTQVPNGWARLTQSATAEPSQTTDVKLTIDVNGYRISVANGADIEILANVCRTLKAL